MKFEKIASKALMIFLLGSLIISGCNSEKEFDPPNKTKISTGQAENVIPVGTAMALIKYSDKMAKVWDNDAILMNVNGVHVAFDGYNRANFNNSQWIITYYSPKKPPLTNAYTITFNGKGLTTWLETSASYDAKNSISNFSIDSDKAIANATKGGLPEGKMYTVELAKNAKGMFWFVGSKLDEGSSKYDVKKVNALSGDVEKL